MSSPRITTYIGAKEGFVSKWYLDPVHVPTIGYGFTWRSKVFATWWMAKHGRKMQRGDTISQTDALAVLKLMLDQEYEPPVLRVMPGSPSNVKEASTSAVFNMGAGSLAWKWALAFARGDLKEGAARLRETGVTGQGSKNKLPGLVKRRGEEADIAEFNRWPSWLKVSVDAPDTHMDEDDIRLAQTILASLGYYKRDVDGIPGPATELAVRQFQTDHGTLRVDGVIGRATLTALTRTRDARSKGKATTGGGLATAGTGGLTELTGVGDQVKVPNSPVTPAASGDADLGIVGDILLWGGLAVVVGGLLYLAWRYRDEFHAIFRRL